MTDLERWKAELIALLQRDLANHHVVDVVGDAAPVDYKSGAIVATEDGVKPTYFRYGDAGLPHSSFNISVMEQHA